MYSGTVFKLNQLNWQSFNCYRYGRWRDISEWPSKHWKVISWAALWLE